MDWAAAGRAVAAMARAAGEGLSEAAFQVVAARLAEPMAAGRLLQSRLARRPLVCGRAQPRAPAALLSWR